MNATNPNSSDDVDLDDVPQGPPNRSIAIVGRPNVGKSALFNRLARKRIAIVHEEAGVTRDRLICEIEWNNDRFDLIDTGGIGFFDDSAPADVIEEGMKQQVLIAIQDAAAIIFVVDLSEGITPLDREVSRLLRGAGQPVFLAANKADVPERDSAAVEFEEFEFPVFSISAMHNRSIDPLIEAAIATLPPAIDQDERAVLNVAVVGRPNAGKSSYINRLIHDERLIVSDVPGTTRDSIDVPFSIGQGNAERHYLFIDTAGVRKKAKATDPVEKFSIMRTENSIKRADVVMLVMDATEGPKIRDKKMANLIQREEKGCIIVVNKWDLADGKITQRQYGKALMDELSFMSYVPVLYMSAESGYNIRRTLEAIDFVATQVDTKLSTGLLNRTILDAHKKVVPPMVKGARLKILYCTQVGSRPIRIKFFVNDPKRTSPQYETYLRKHLRKAFGLEGAPIIFHFTKRASKDYEN